MRIGSSLHYFWRQLGALTLGALMLTILAVPANAAGVLKLEEQCRTVTQGTSSLAQAAPSLASCATPAARYRHGVIWVAYRPFPTWLEPGKTWRLALDNHTSAGVDVWLIGAGGRAQRLHYDPNASDREWLAGNYQSLLVTPSFPVNRVILRLSEAQAHTYVRPPLMARAKTFAPIERNQAAIYGMGVGMLALTILFHLSLFFAIRRRFQLIYCGHVALLLAYGLCYSGIVRLVVPALGAEAISNLLGFTMVAATGTGVAFLVEFLGSALKAWVRRWAKLAAWLSLGTATLVLIAPDRWNYAAFLIANLAATHAILLTTGILAVSCWKRHTMADIIALGWAVPIIVSLMYPARTLGLIPMSSIPDGLMMFASTIECLILSLPVTSRIRRLRLEHERAQERHLVLERQAQTDLLTGLANRRGLGDAMTRADAAHAEPVPLALLVIDIDHFKRVNDRYGHGTGDEILRHVAAHVARVAGAGAIVARHGGEEFVVALRGYDLPRAATIAERIRASTAPAFDATPQLPVVTISIGVAAGQSDQFAALLEDADCALYRAKNEGRNRVMLADGPLMYAAAA